MSEESGLMISFMRRNGDLQELPYALKKEILLCYKTAHPEFANLMLNKKAIDCTEFDPKKFKAFGAEVMRVDCDFMRYLYANALSDWNALKKEDADESTYIFVLRKHRGTYIKWRSIPEFIKTLYGDRIPPEILNGHQAVANFILDCDKATSNGALFRDPLNYRPTEEEFKEFVASHPKIGEMSEETQVALWNNKKIRDEHPEVCYERLASRFSDREVIAEEYRKNQPERLLLASFKSIDRGIKRNKSDILGFGLPDGQVIDGKGNICGKCDENGYLVNENGDVIGKKAGQFLVATNEKGETIGFIDPESHAVLSLDGSWTKCLWNEKENKVVDLLTGEEKGSGAFLVPKFEKLSKEEEKELKAKKQQENESQTENVADAKENQGDDNNSPKGGASGGAEAIEMADETDDKGSFKAAPKVMPEIKEEGTIDTKEEIKEDEAKKIEVFTALAPIESFGSKEVLFAKKEKEERPQEESKPVTQPKVANAVEEVAEPKVETFTPKTWGKGLGEAIDSWKAELLTDITSFTERKPEFSFKAPVMGRIGADFVPQVAKIEDYARPKSDWRKEMFGKSDVDAFDPASYYANIHDLLERIDMEKMQEVMQEPASKAALRHLAPETRQCFQDMLNGELLSRERQRTTSQGQAKPFARFDIGRL